MCGGAGSGKTTFANELITFLGDACTLGTDDYVVGDREYRRKNLEGKNPLLKYNPEALNENIRAIKKLQEGEFYMVPKYDDVTGEAVDAKEYHKKITPVKYIVVEGDFDFVNNPDLLIYFDVDDETRLQNRIRRDLAKGRDIDEEAIRKNFALRQELQHIPYTEPARKKAHMIVSAKLATGQANIGGDNTDLYQYDFSYRGKEWDDMEEEL